MKTLIALANQWLTEAQTLERYGDTRGAGVLRLHASELQEAIRRDEADLLTLAQAAQLSGYTADHLRHLIADGTIHQAGRKGSPRIKRGDLPMKAGGRAASGFDPDAEAEKILDMVNRKERIA